MKKCLFCIIPILIFSACGGGGSGGSNSSSSNTETLTGTAATGAPLKNAKISIKDSTGKSVDATADADGKYNAEIGGMTPPMILKAEGKISGSTKEYYSFSSNIPNNRIINISQATDSMANSLDTGKKPDDLFTSPLLMASMTQDDFDKIDQAHDNLLKTLEQFLKTLGEFSDPTNEVDIFSMSFDANHQGLDKMYDCMSYDDNSKKISIKSTCHEGNEMFEVFDPLTDSENDFTPPSDIPMPDSEAGNFIGSFISEIIDTMEELSTESTTDNNSNVLQSHFETLIEDGATVQSNTKDQFISGQISYYNDDKRFEYGFVDILAFNYSEKTADICYYFYDLNDESNSGEKSLSIKKNGENWQITSDSQSITDMSFSCM